MTHPAAIVLAGGLGTRMLSTRPKLLHELCGRPLLAYVLDAARAATGANPIVVVSPATAAVREAFPDGVTFALQERPDGTGDALRAGLAAVRADADEVVVLNGDVPLVDPGVLLGALDARRATGAALALVSFDTWDPGRLGRVIRTADGAQVARIVEVKDASEDELEVTEVNAGFYAFDVAWLRAAIGRLHAVLHHRGALSHPARRHRHRRRPPGRRGRGRRRRQPRRDQRPGPARRGDGHAPGAHQHPLAGGRCDDARPGDRLRRRGRRAGGRRHPRAERRAPRLHADRGGDRDRDRQPAHRHRRRPALPRLGRASSSGPRSRRGRRSGRSATSAPAARSGRAPRSATTPRSRTAASRPA